MEVMDCRSSAGFSEKPDCKPGTSDLRRYGAWVLESPDSVGSREISEEKSRASRTKNDWCWYASSQDIDK
jgi:hypothetical protein